MIPKKTVDVEGATLEEARKQIDAHLSEGLAVLEEHVIADGRPKTANAIGDTTEDAYANAKSELPVDAVILYKRQLSAPSHHAIEIRTPHGVSAIAHLTVQGVNLSEIRNIRLVRTGRTGFFGIGARPDRYEGEQWRPAVVEVTYRLPARISAVIGVPDVTFIKLAVIEEDGSLLLGEDAAGNKVDLHDVTEAALLFVPRHTLPSLEADMELWRRVKTEHAEDLLPGEFRVSVVDTYAEAATNVKGPASA